MAGQGGGDVRDRAAGVEGRGPPAGLEGASPGPLPQQRWLDMRPLPAETPLLCSEPPPPSAGASRLSPLGPLPSDPSAALCPLPCLAPAGWRLCPGDLDFDLQQQRPQPLAQSSSPEASSTAGSCSLLQLRPAGQGVVHPEGPVPRSGCPSAPSEPHSACPFGLE